MKKCLFIAMLLTLITATDSQAQQRRRFFQNLFGQKENSQKTQRAPTENQANKDAKSGSRESKNTASDFRSRSHYLNQNYRTPTLASPSQRTNSRSPSKPKSSSTSYRPKSVPAYQAKTKSRSSGTKRKGFGFSVTLNDDDEVIVSSVDRNGNAAEEGIRRGDHILEIGGIEASSVEEFEEIAKIMNNGDQMEFKIKRSSREKTLEIMFGDLPEIEEKSEPITDSTNSRRSADSKRYDFAPPVATRSTSVNSVFNSRRNTPEPIQQNFNDKSESRRIRSLNKTIQNQNRQIQMLQRQIQQLQQRRSR